MQYTIVTGAAGFIGSCMVNKLNNQGLTQVVVVDDFSIPSKQGNLEHKSIALKIHRNEFFGWLKENASQVACIYHLGARTDTTEFDKSIFDRLNLNYSKQLWDICTVEGIPLIYASSAATYGMGEYGYIDNHEIVEQLKPLNPYGESKNDFDKWVLKQSNTPPFWAGVKFFNVYGPNEYHKGRMASVVFHAYHQIRETGMVKLFRSHKEGYKDGMQLRDFIYVKDVVDVLYFLMQKKQESGLFNLGTGKARAFLHLAEAVFAALGKPSNIEFIDTPIDIRDKYQYFTEADMNKVIVGMGFPSPFYTLEEGVTEYVQQYLAEKRYF
ncbi:MAG: ADP-glyceromanno-heptose 6-epimerase [Bacteroidales bacterium]|nr:ADP-glyceromanno-heptose 6-epimerase [Bacteroidales bacterium]